LALDRYEAIAVAVNRPLVITEVGFGNREGAAYRPWEWPEDLSLATPTLEGERQQALAYKAIINTFGQSERVNAMYWWRWFTDTYFESFLLFTFSPRNKLAEQMLRSACR
jgi:hypothetical protein